MINFENLFNNKNISIVEQRGSIKVLAYNKDLSPGPAQAMQAYFAAQMNVKMKQVLVELNNTEVVASSGAMQWMAGGVSMVSNVKGVGDFIGKAISGAATKESAIKPKYVGSGLLMLEPTFKHILLEDVGAWGGLVLEDGLFLACEGAIKHKVEARSNFSSALLGNEGLFNLSLVGDGIAVLESPVPREELITINLDNDEIKIDGSFAIAWSKSLQFTVERSTKSLIASAAGGEGLVNVYRGTGKILMAPVDQNAMNLYTLHRK